MKLGGVEGLKATMEEGMCNEYKGLYFLPRASVGHGRQFTDSKELSRSQESTDED